MKLKRMNPKNREAEQHMKKKKTGERKNRSENAMLKTPNKM